MPNIHGWEWLVILVVVLLLFGATRIPALMRSLGASVKEFRKGLKEGEKEESNRPDPAPPSKEGGSSGPP